jgi:hypothetical protein
VYALIAWPALPAVCIVLGILNLRRGYPVPAAAILAVGAIYVGAWGTWWLRRQVKRWVLRRVIRQRRQSYAER